MQGSPDDDTEHVRDGGVDEVHVTLEVLGERVRERADDLRV